MSVTKATSSRRWFRFSPGTLVWIALIGATAAYGIHQRLTRQRLASELVIRQAEQAESDRISEEVHAFIKSPAASGPAGPGLGGFFELHNFGPRSN
jgi:hypothetical protein